MKRKYVVAVLLIYVLIACTFFSVKIEKTMMTQVTAVTVDSVEKVEIPITALFRDENGQYLYHAEEGVGWLEGLRAQECEDNTYTVDYYRQVVDGSSLWDQTVILSASRQPKIGEKVNVLEQRETVTDLYLFVYPEGVPASLSESTNANLTLQSLNAALIEVSDAQMPFLEHDVKNQFEAYQREGWKAYSLQSVEKMAESFPKAILAFVLFLIPVMLLLLTCILPQTGSKLLWINIGASAVALVGIFALLSSIDLPPSLVPVDNIFDFTHYTNILSEIESALAQLQYGNTLDIMRQSAASSVWVAIIGCGVAALLLMAEVLLWKTQRRKDVL